MRVPFRSRSAASPPFAAFLPGVTWTTLYSQAAVSQTRDTNAVEITPVVGLYSPMAPLVNPHGFRFCFDFPCGTSTGPQEAALGYGARLTDWVSRRVGLDFSVRRSSGSLVYNNNNSSG